MSKKEAKERIEKLKKTINYHRYLYHVLDKQEISDAALDSLKKELFNLEQEYPDLITEDSPTQRVGGQALKEFKKVSHPERMLSFNDAFSNEDMIQLALMELEEMKLVDPKKFIKGFIVKIANVYPVYSPDYQKHLKVIRNFTEKIENLSLMGREGLFRYDNSDHAILTGLYAARNYLGKKPQDVWSVNTEKVYHEEWAAEGA